MTRSFQQILKNDVVLDSIKLEFLNGLGDSGEFFGQINIFTNRYNLLFRKGIVIHLENKLQSPYPRVSCALPFAYNYGSLLEQTYIPAPKNALC